MGIDPITICNQKPIRPKRENAPARLFVHSCVIGPLGVAYSIANGAFCDWRQVPGLASASQSAPGHAVPACQAPVTSVSVSMTPIRAMNRLIVLGVVLIASWRH